MIGPKPGVQEELRILNRTRRWCKDGLVFGGDFEAWQRDCRRDGRVLLRPISTQAIVFFYLGQFYLGQVQLRPILACPFDHPKCQDEKKRKN